METVAPALDAVELTKTYGGSRGIADVSLRVERGECFGFLGPNGAGKTTFIRLALGLLRPHQGSVSIMGTDLSEDRLGALANVGYLPGELALYPALTGARTLDALARLHPRPSTLRDELLDLLDLERRDLGRRVREYSRGMKQKLGLVAALQHDPPLVILDEPTGGLDPVMQARLLDYLAARSRAGRTIFFSSHVLSEVEQLCDRVAMVRDGRLLLVRRVEDLPLGSLRMVRVTFSEPMPSDVYRATNVSGLEVDGSTHRFTFTGNPAPVIAALANLPVIDLVIEPARLEDLFRNLYDPTAVEVPV